MMSTKKVCDSYQELHDTTRLNYLNNYGVALYLLGQPNEAKPILEEALSVFNASSTTLDSAIYPVILSSLSMCYAHLDSFDIAIQKIDNSLNFLKRRNQEISETYANALTNKAFCFFRKKKFDLSSKLIAEALNIYAEAVSYTHLTLPTNREV